MPKLIDYLESARADNTGTSQMDRLLAEDEISNMHTEGSLWADEGYDPVRAITEGDFTPLGAVLKKTKHTLTMLDAPKKMRNELKKLGFTKEQIKNMPAEIAVPFLKERKMGDYAYDYTKQKWVDIKTGKPHKGFQTGGPISYLQSAAQDETAHTNMDRLIAEYGQSQEPQYSMREFQEPYDPARAIAEGSFMPIAGALGMVKGGKGPIGKQAAYFKNMLDDVISQKINKGQVEQMKKISSWEKPLSKDASEAQYIKHLLKQYGVHGERTL